MSASKFIDGKEELVWIPLLRRGAWEFIDFSPKDFFNGLPLALQNEALPEEELGAETEIVHQEIGNFDGHDALEGIHQGVPHGIVDSNGEEAADEEIIPSLSVRDTSPPITWTSDIDPQLFLSSSLPLLSVSDVDSQLLDFYIYELSPKCSLSVDFNPYLNVLLPVAYEYEPLRHTLLAASACQLYHFSGDRQYELYSLRHRSKAMSGLNKHLTKEHMDWKSLATMVMFCFRDITDGCEPSWITHLKMGLRMLKNLLCTTHIDKDLRKFCEIYFVAHDVMGRTAWGDDATDSEHYDWDQDETYHEIDSIMGCSRELISLISRISCLASSARQQNDAADHTIAAAGHLMDQLAGLHQTLRTGVGHAETMLRIAEAKRLSAMLYLHDRVMAPHTGATTALAHGLRNAIIEAIQQLPASSGAALWPLFILGKSNTSSRDQAQFVLDRLHQLEKSRYLGSFYHARRRVERNIMRRLTAHGDVLQQTWEDESALNDNERWVSLA
ncbi:uncharacterized protein N0V89_004998 [Didymosphaeria variabile]|uniref:Uncharacterized protein n=1 Tax=Didymosphaeria variabile TaxID=1932322 RepID=A0A9W9CA25_9PLEO|nr:uncharacterized protein N0V89_004998 [Didymosphaeria variabile]KAJ4353271.1 hypothetical protein N0V89_004998 [Didymosphaeria variabile]